MKRLLRNVAIIMCIILLAPSVLSCLPSVQGVTSAQAAEKKAKLQVKSGTVGIQSSPEYLFLKNQKSKAKYTYTSSDKTIATVNKYGIITGISVGSTTITVKETYKKKTTEVGTYTVTVVNSSLTVTTAETGINSIYFPQISYQNRKADYTYTTSDSKIITTNDDGMLVGLTKGTADVTVTETYNGVKRTLGTIKVSVIEIPITTLEFDPFYSDDGSSIPSTTFELGDDEDYNISYYLITEPYDATTAITYTSSNESIIKVDATGKITIIAAGSATITATAGTLTTKMQITVTSGEADDNSDEE